MMISKDLSYLDIFVKDLELKNKLYKLLQTINRDCWIAQNLMDMVSFDDDEYYAEQLFNIVNDYDDGTLGPKTYEWCEEVAKLFAARAWADGFHYWMDEPAGVADTVRDWKLLDELSY